VQGSTAVGTAVGPASASDAEGSAATDGLADAEGATELSADGAAIAAEDVATGIAGAALPLAVDAEQAASTTLARATTVARERMVPGRG